MKLISTLTDWWGEIRQRYEQAHASISDDSPEDLDIADLTPDVMRPQFEEVGAWAGMESLMNPERDAAFAARLGLTFLECIINDDSAQRGPTPYTTRQYSLIVGLASACRRHGLNFTLMTWLMPHRPYIKAMGTQLTKLCLLTGARRVTLDAEEPCTQAVDAAGRRLKPSDYQAAADALRRYVVQPLNERGVTVWVSGIRYAPTSKLKRFVDWTKGRHRSIANGEVLGAVCNGGTPQCYSTSSSKANPLTVVAKGAATWRGKFGERIPLIIAGAAYRQSGIKGHSVRSAIVAFFDACDEFFQANPSLRRIVILWGINSIRRDPRVAGAVQSVTSTGLAPEPAPEADTEPLDVT